MLKRFFMNTLSSFMGAWIALVVFCVVAVIVAIGMAVQLGDAFEGNTEKIKPRSVMVLELDRPIIERAVQGDIDYMALMSGEFEQPLTLIDLQAAVRAASDDDNVEAIYLKCGAMSASPATLNALRRSLGEFKEGGKKIIAYADSYGMGAYFLATVADEVFINPMGEVGLQGLGGTSLFFKGLFDKLGVEFQVVKVGTFKSAVEPYILTDMSAPARAQLDTLYGNMWNKMCLEMSEGRAKEKLTPEKINSAINDEFLALRKAEFAKDAGFVNQLSYEREMDSIVASRLGHDVDDLNFISPQTVAASDKWGKDYHSKNRIAVLYATGEIVDGGKNGTINFEKLVPQIVDLADDDDVKGMVLRVNSPGGAVFGSSQIGEALDYFQSKGKPLAVSMGDYAASGGYWISACADRIFADALTITGSIGIFGLIPNVKGLAEKAGINPVSVSTNPEADFPVIFKPMTERQKNALQKNVEEGYDMFVARVAKGRGMTEAQVRVIGEGRVWDAMKAKEIGLVDEIGNLYDAVKWVGAELGDAKEMQVAVYPKLEKDFLDILPQLAEMQGMKSLMPGEGTEIPAAALEFGRRILTQKPLQARMPYMTVGFQPTPSM